MKMLGNTILITGGTSGIGCALAESLHDLGNRVIVAGRRRDLLDGIATARPGLAGLHLDLDDPASLPRLAEEVRGRFPELDVLVANAGIPPDEDMTAEGWDASDARAIVDTEVMGVLRVVAAFLPMLKARTDATVMATGSALAFVPRADFPACCASKVFLHSWLQSLRHQLRHVPVEVLELSPPYVQTALTGEGQRSDPRAMPLAAYVDETLRKLWAGALPRGELLLDRDLPRRSAERDGRYDEAFALLNPA